MPPSYPPNAVERWPAFEAGSEYDGVRSEEQLALLYKRISTVLSYEPVGRDISFRCFAADGGPYYCKEDRDFRPIRATEWVSTMLAQHVGIAVADPAVLEDDELNTFFGSKGPTSVASDREVELLLNRPSRNELGQAGLWPGQYLASLFAFDMFVGNPDRCIRNFVLDRSAAPHRLCAIDFASAHLIGCTADRFPVESDHTVWVGRAWQKTHGTHFESAQEMLDRLAAVPWSVMDRIVQQMPIDWLDPAQREGLIKFWEGGVRLERISRLRAFFHEPKV